MAIEQVIGRVVWVKVRKVVGLVLSAGRPTSGKGPKRRRYIAEVMLDDGTIARFRGKALRFTKRPAPE